MATGDRSQKIRTRVQQSLKDPEGQSIAFAGAVYDAINRVQDRICEEASADQSVETVSVVANTELYSLPSGFFGERAILPGSTTPLEKLNMAQVADVKRLGTSVTGSTSDPMYYYYWNDKIGFLTSSGTAPGSASTVTIYGWKTRKDDGTEDASDSVDPIVNKRWDTCLWLGAVADIAGDAGSATRYELEFARAKNLELAYRGGSYTVSANRDYD